MNRTELINKVRADARDFSNSIFREPDIILYINEGIDRIRQVIKECKPMIHLTAPTQSPIILPNEYHSLLATFSTSRCFAQDEKYNQASNLMNEFEVKLEELKSKIESGEIVIKDPETGEDITTTNTTDYVYDNYFTKKNYDSDDELLLESDV